MAESLLTPSSVLMFGRVLSDLKLSGSSTASSGGGGFLSSQIGASNAKLARIYGFSFDGQYIDLVPPAIFLVHGNGTKPKKDLDLSGIPLTDEDFATDIMVWTYDKSDLSIRLDPLSGTLEDILLAYELGDMGSFAGAQARGAQARGAQARGAQARGAQARGAQARGAQARGAQARGNSD